MKSPSQFFNLSPMKQKKILKKVLKQSNKDQMQTWGKGMSILYKPTKDLLIAILAHAESMKTAKEVRHLLKEYILKL